jgi:flagellar FliL protein
MSAEMYDDDMGGRGRGMVTRKRLSGKKVMLFAAPVVLILAAAVYLYLSGFLSSFSHKAAAEQPAADKATVISYYDLPDMLVNLRSDGPRPSFLKISVSLEINHAEDKAVLDRVLPRVIDTFQVYLRELRVDQLQGSAGLLRLREELLARVNAALKPSNVHVNDVLFKEMLVQ